MQSSDECIIKESNKNEQDKLTQEVVGWFRKQAQISEENLDIIKSQYSKVQQIYMAKIDNLENELKNLKKKYYK